MDREFIETQREFNREALGFAHGYLQGLVVIGYAGLYFLWDKTEDRLPPAVWAVAGLLLCISVGVYLAWETFAFLFRQRVLMQQALAVGKPGEEVDPEAFRTGMAERLEKLRNFLPAVRAMWYPAMFAIVLPAALAWGIVLGAFVVGLIRVICHSA